MKLMSMKYNVLTLILEIIPAFLKKKRKSEDALWVERLREHGLNGT